MQKFTTRRLAYDAVLVAMYFVLAAFCSINVSNAFRFTLDALPIVLAALCFGPADGVIVGGLGAFFYQVYYYGVGYTTALWMVPAVVRGLFLGLIAKKKRFDMKNTETLVYVIISSLIVTGLNTVITYLDGLIWHYSVAVLAMLPWRVLCSVIVAVLYGVLAPVLVKALFRAGYGARTAEEEDSDGGAFPLAEGGEADGAERCEQHDLKDESRGDCKAHSEETGQGGR